MAIKKIKSNCRQVIDQIVRENKMGYRDLARLIGEDSSDISRWRANDMSIKSKAVVKICKLYPWVVPHDLNPDAFPKNLRFIYIKKEKIGEKTEIEKQINPYPEEKTEKVWCPEIPDLI